MKILISSDINSYKNPYISSLYEGLKKINVDITCSLNEFWNNWKAYDIIHIQWPNLLLTKHNYNFVTEHLRNIRKEKKIIVTCHNLVPHYSNNTELINLYDYIYSIADTIIHMGEYSRNILKLKYPYVNHIIIPHHIYNNIYTQIPYKDESIQKLHLSKKYKYILCFGAFRDEEERILVKYVAENFNKYNYKVLAPGFCNIQLRKNIFMVLISVFKFIKMKIRYKNIIFGYKFITDKMLPYYYAASDIALIQRKKILNSGNLPLALMMGKVVVAPNIGNISDIMSKINNPTFNPNDIQSLYAAINHAILLSKKSIFKAFNKSKGSFISIINLVPLLNFILLR